MHFLYISLTFLALMLLMLGCALHWVKSAYEADHATAWRICRYHGLNTSRTWVSREVETRRQVMTLNRIEGLAIGFGLMFLSAGCVISLLLWLI